MKKLITITMVLAFALCLNAQVTTPQPSPLSKLEQKVGLTDITIEYSRPGVKDRKIFGGLESYGKMWRAGANKNTIITFSDPVTIAGEYKLKPGSYSIFVELNESIWVVYFYSDTENWGIPKKWDESKVVAIAKVQVQKIPFKVETFTIDINNIRNGSATINIMWDNSYASIPFQVPTDDKVLESINKTLNGKPTSQDYYAAAVYYLQENKDIKQAKEWVDKSMSMTDEPQYWQLRQQSLIYAKVGDKEGAIDLAKKSLEGAKKAKNEQYVKFNEGSLKEWGAN